MITKTCKRICFFLVTLCFLTGCSSGKYSDSIYENWGIKLSNEWRVLYECQNVISPLGDGERYHIFECDDFETVKDDIDWVTEQNDSVERMIASTIEGLPIKSGFEININTDYEYYYMQKDDNSKLFIVHILNGNLIYIIEVFM